MISIEGSSPGNAKEDIEWVQGGETFNERILKALEDIKRDIRNTQQNVQKNEKDIKDFFTNNNNTIARIFLEYLVNIFISKGYKIDDKVKVLSRHGKNTQRLGK